MKEEIKQISKPHFSSYCYLSLHPTATTSNQTNIINVINKIASWKVYDVNTNGFSTVPKIAVISSAQYCIDYSNLGNAFFKGNTVELLLNALLREAPFASNFINILGFFISRGKIWPLSGGHFGSWEHALVTVVIVDRFFLPFCEASEEIYERNF